MKRSKNSMRWVELKVGATRRRYLFLKIPGLVLRSHCIGLKAKRIDVVESSSPSAYRRQERGRIPWTEYIKWIMVYVAFH